MIIEALVQYYKDHENIFPPRGSEKRKIDFVIVLREDGSVVSAEDRRDAKGNGQIFIVPKLIGRSGPTPKANLLWDNIEYTLGDSVDLNKKKKAEKKKLVFVEKIKLLLKDFPDHKGVSAVLNFYNQHFDAFTKTETYKNIIQFSTAYLSFQLQGSELLIAEDPCFFNLSNEDVAETGVCMISGVKTELCRLFSFVPVGKEGGSKLISFKDDRGYDSYNRQQGYNAPISKDIDYFYSTALNHLNRKGSPNSFSINDRYFVFWAAPKEARDEPTEFELMFGHLYKGKTEEKVQEVKRALMSPKTGIVSTEGENMFYIMGFSPNKVRLSVNYWKQETVASLSTKILQHFEDLEICGDQKKDYSFNTLFQLLLSVSLNNEAKNIQPNLAEKIMDSILEGTPYPNVLAQSCLRRIRAKQGVTTRRAAILKAYINRKNRFNNYTNIQLSMALDINNENLGYLCGRLLAVVEKIQKETMGITSIRERYMNSASATPAMVFSRIMNLSNYHLAKSDNKGFVIMMEKLKGEIMSKIPSSGFPSRLSFDDQATFMVGYYHQRQSFFEKITEESK